MREIIVKENEAGQRLDKLLHKILPDASMGFLYKMLRKKNIVWNGKRADGSEKTVAGDCIQFFLAEETFEKFSGRISLSNGKKVSKTTLKTAEYQRAFDSFQGIRVLYEDQNVLLLHKPIGILSQKAEAGELSLNEWMCGYLLKKHRFSEEDFLTFRPSVCNRLDRNTSGIVVCGISLAGTQKMNALLKERSVHKFYRLLVKGRITQQAHLTGYLHKDEKTNMVRVLSEKQYRELAEQKKRVYSRIETKYVPIMTRKVKHVQEEISLLEVELITGKTHQIRAHLSSIGHPLVGDPKYGDLKWNEVFFREFGIKNQLLHAFRLEFPKLDAPFEALSHRSIVDEMPIEYEQILKS
ncbi:MAG: RluA family pseudouridine synthase [Clostridiales bacterium]|nr:RluA family pseudouridine synthase [Clostridiales bacterium]